MNGRAGGPISLRTIDEAGEGLVYQATYLDSYVALSKESLIKRGAIVVILGLGLYLYNS